MAVMTTTEVRPRIYVACLASYNNGDLFGRWIDLTTLCDGDDLKEQIAEVLESSPAPGAEEYAVHDSEGLPSWLRSEWPDLNVLMEYVTTWDSVDEPGAYRYACENAGVVLDEDDFRSCFYGTYPCTNEFAFDYYEQSGQDLGPLENYIDWSEVWSSEFDCAGWHAEPDGDGSVWIFSS